MKKLVNLMVCVTLWSTMVVVIDLQSQDSLKEQVVTTGKIAAGQIITAPEKMFLTPEQRTKRIAELRAAARDSEIKMSADELKEAFFEYLLLQCASLFQGLADALSEGVTKIGGDPKAAEAVKRLPAAFADGVYLTFHLIKSMANKQYLEHIKSLRAALNCLLKKSARSTSECVAYTTLNKALFGVFEHTPEVLLPIVQVTVAGINVGGRNVKGLVPLGITVIDPQAKVLKHLDIVAQILNLVFVFSEQLKNMESSLSLTDTLNASPTLPAKEPSVTGSLATPPYAESAGTAVSAAEEAEYKALAQKNAQASQIFKDLQVFAALSHEVTKLFPNDRAIGGVVIPLRDMAQAAIACLYNISELGFGIIKIIDEKAKPLSLAASCLKYTNHELKAAAREGKLVDDYIVQCGPAHCKNKKECIVNMLITMVESIKLIFDNVLVKYDPKTQTSQRGLLMNIDVIVDVFMKLLLATPIVKEGLNKTAPDGAAKAEDFVKKINSLRTLIKYFGQALSGIMEAFIFVAAQIDFKSIPKETVAEYTELFDEGMWGAEISDEELDKIFGELNFSEGV